MNQRERDAWAKFVADQLPEHPDQSSAVMTVAGRLPSKANLHEVRFDPSLWAELKFIVDLWRKRHPGKKPFWVSPGDTVKSWEEVTAYQIRDFNKGRFSGPLTLDIELIGQKIDVDAVKIIPDAIQRAGLIRNDNQFTKLTVTKTDSDVPAVRFQIHRVPK